MNNKPVITISVYNRMEFITNTLNSLLNCDGIEKFKVVISLDDPKNIEMQEFLDTIPIDDKVIIVNKRRMGCDLAIREAVNRGFDYSDKVIHLEDDILLSYDGLHFFDYVLDKHKDDNRINVVTGFSRDCMTEENCNQYVVESTWYPWGWATWKSSWSSFIKPRWKSISWDVNLKRSIKSDNLGVIRPTVSRTKHIGYYGTHVHSKDFWDKKWNSYDWIDDKESGMYLPGEYHRKQSGV